MPITLDFLENGYIARYVFDGGWSAIELVPLYAQEDAHRRSVDHIVHTLIDIQTMANIPGNVLRYAKGSPTLRSTNEGQLVMVGTNSYAKSLLEIVCKLAHYSKIQFASNQHEGIRYLKILIQNEQA